MSLKRTQADIWFSKVVRLRDNYTCQKCQTQYPHNSTGLHSSHHYSRTNRRIRWALDNAIALCFKCHKWYEGNPLDSGQWLEDKIGAEVVQSLRDRMNTNIKVSKLEEKDIGKHYKEQFKLLSNDVFHKLKSWQ